MRPTERRGGTASLGSFLAAERSRLFDGASQQRKEQLRAAERQREVYRAWNSVCANTREGSHVTGLHYAPSSNELVVYTDGAVWTQELTMLREIIRARMELAGAAVDDIVVKTSRPGHRAAAAAGRAEGGDGGAAGASAAGATGGLPPTDVVGAAPAGPRSAGGRGGVAGGRANMVHGQSGRGVTAVGSYSSAEAVVPEAALTASQLASIDAAVKGVEHEGLRESLRRAMVASLGRPQP